MLLLSWMDENKSFHLPQVARFSIVDPHDRGGQTHYSNQKHFKFLQVLLHVDPALVETLSNPTLNFIPVLVKGEIERPLQYSPWKLWRMR